MESGLTVFEVLPLVGSVYFVAWAEAIASKLAPTLDFVNAKSTFTADPLWERACSR